MPVDRVYEVDRVDKVNDDLIRPVRDGAWVKIQGWKFIQEVGTACKRFIGRCAGASVTGKRRSELKN